MRYIELPPRKLLVSDDTQEEIVSIYLSLIARGYRDAVGRVIAAPIEQINHEFTDIGKTSHLILDGNNRAVAYTLIDKMIPVIEVVDQSDILACRDMARSGVIPDFPHKSGKFDTIVNEGVEGFVSDERELHKYTKCALRDEVILIRKLPLYVRKKIKSK